MNANNLNKIIELRHQLHMYPELSCEEVETKETLMKFIEGNTSLEVVDKGRWFYCVKPRAQANSDNAKTPIAFRADFDALPIDEHIDASYTSQNPGISHKCGHDGHSAALAGFALELDDMDVNRDVYLIFQHGEEIGAGGEECSRLIPDKGISEVYAFHNVSGFPKGSIVYREGLTQPASKGLTIEFTGKTSHAANPEEGNNPSFVIADVLTKIRELLEEPHDGMLLCTIVNIELGTKDFGVSAGSGEISMTLRAENEAEMDELEMSIRNAALEFAAKQGIDVGFSVSDPFPETRNDAEALERVRAVARSLNFEIVEEQEIWRASEDFGWYLKRCPGAIFYIGNGEGYPALHTIEYDFPDEILGIAVDMFSALI